MITIETLPNGDWKFLPNGGLSVISGRAAVAQAAAEYVQTIYGEKIFNTESGIRQNIILGTGIASSTVEFFIRQRLLEVPGVTAVPFLSVTIEKNLLRYTATIETIYGAAELNG